MPLTKRFFYVGLYVGQTSKVRQKVSEINGFWRADWNKSGNFYCIEINAKNMSPLVVQRFEEVFGIDKRRRYRRTAYRKRADYLASLHLTDLSETSSRLSVTAIAEILKAEFKLTRRRAYAAAYKAVADVLEEAGQKSEEM